jgi:transposase-like protein
MDKCTLEAGKSPAKHAFVGTCEGISEATAQVRSALDEVVLRGAMRMLQAALEMEVDNFVQQHKDFRDTNGRRRIVRNGHLPARTILTGAGALTLEQPRARDRRGGAEGAIRFSSSILPPYLRRSKNVDELIPWLYLKGISTGDFTEALQALLGPSAPGLSANVVVRLKEQWHVDFEAWRKRDLSEKRYVYFWVDGVYFNVRLEGDRQCILVIIGATDKGEKELVAVQDGYRESEQSWRELLEELRLRGLKLPPSLAVGDGALGFWAAMRKVLPTTREQRCWVHKTANVLDKMPRSVQGKAKADLHEIWMAETREKAEKAFDAFIAKYKAKYSKAVECLTRDREVLMTFYDFPAEHWVHLRTTNPVESTFATVRLRHCRTKGNGSRIACLTMVFKLMEMAQRHWRKLNQPELTCEVLKGTKFVDGVKQEKAA